VVVKDCHASAVPPGRRRGSYGDEILHKLALAGMLADTVHGHVLCAGDLVHFKSPSHQGNTYSYINELGDLLHSYPGGQMFGIVGNHDLTADNLETLPDQPLGNLIMAGAYHNLATQPVIFEAEDIDPGAAFRVRVDGYNFERDARVTLEAIQTARPDPSCKYRVALIHSYGCEGKTTSMFGEWALGFDDLIGSPYDAFIWGHDHKPKGIIQVGSQTHLYLGSLSRAALTADEADRPVTVAVLSFSPDGIKVLERELQVQPLELAFHTATLDVDHADQRADVVDHRAATSSFLAEMQGHAEAVESEDPKELLLTLTDDQAIIREICDACDLH
jgi:DNA repair exonuclease SbcCD nuclease subunit